jgi:mannosyl-oligosaccharide alpha-1,2-mannosidase
MTLARLTRRSALVSMAAAGLAPGLASAQAKTGKPKREDWKALAADVRREFQWAWQGYVAKAWGKDEINPVSGTSQSFFVEGHDLGLSLVEALDTLWIMGLDAEFQAGVDWVKANLISTSTARPRSSRPISAWSAA